MDYVTFQLLKFSVKKWGGNEQEREDMFWLCCENYHIKLAGKSLNDKTDHQYLSVLFRNSCIDVLRKKRQISRNEILYTDMREEWQELLSVTSNPFQDSDCNLLVEDFLQNTKDTEKVLAEALLDDVPYQEIVDKTKLNICTIRSKIHRLRHRWVKSERLSGIMNSS